jgi:hypothetical protein
MLDIGLNQRTFDPPTHTPSLDSSAADCRPPIELKGFGGRIVLPLTNVLAARYPVVRRLTGHESFPGVTRAYVSAYPPRSATLANYGESFPEFLKSLGAASSIEYLADVAALEWAHYRAAHAPRVAPAQFRPLSWRRGKRLSALRVSLHPSASVVISRFPIVTIWEANRRRVESRTISCRRPEAALVARPCIAVECRLLPAGGPAFLEALRSGRTIGGAIAAARLTAPGFDHHLNLELLAQSRVVVDWF